MNDTAAQDGPPGLRVLRAADWGPHEDATLRAIIDAAEEHDGRAPVDEAVHLLLAHHGLERATIWLVDGQAFAMAHWRDDDDGADAGHPTHLELVTAPTARWRGLGGALAELALQSRPGPWAAWSHGDHPAARRLAQRFGFEATRSLWVMRLAEGHDVLVREAPADVELRGFRSGDEHGLLAVNAAAFADHPEQGALDRAGFDQRVAEPWFDPAGLIVAERDGELVGFHWTKTHDAPVGAAPHGEVYVIAVAPSMQGSGLGVALLDAGIEHLRSRGYGEVLLYVESDNPAVGLYERAGFTHDPADTHVQYTRS